MKKQTEYIGLGTISKLPEIVKEFGAKKVFLVTGNKSFDISGAKEHVEKITEAEILRFSDFSGLPLYEDIQKGIEVYKNFHPDLVIAIGGGSVIDVAKAINNLAGESKNPLIAIPTTSGSGSEATHFAVIYKKGVKSSLSDGRILPDICIVDPQLALTTPKGVALASALDALTQGIESHWSSQATDESKSYAMESLELCWKNIISAIESRDKVAMAEMSKAAHLAGKAINISKTTACHALSYGLSYHFGVPHGIAVSVFLPNLMRFNHAKLPHGITAESVRVLLKRFDIIGLNKYGVRESDIANLVREVNVERLANNPRPVTESDIHAFYKDNL